MKRIYALIIGVFALGALQAQKTISDPNVQVRDLKNFQSIQLSSAFDVYISQGNTEAVAVSSSDPDYLGDIRTEVSGGVLRIYMDYKGKWTPKMNKLKFKAYISFKDLEKLSVSGACDVYFEGVVRVNALKLDLSGASDLKGKVDVQKLDIDQSGASDITLTGSVGQLKVESSGASNFKGYDLVTEFADARASGASNVNITVNKELSAQASGASDIHYRGAAVIRDLKTSGASSVSKKG